MVNLETHFQPRSSNQEMPVWGLVLWEIGTIENHEGLEFGGRRSVLTFKKLLLPMAQRCNLDREYRQDRTQLEYLHRGWCFYLACPYVCVCAWCCCEALPHNLAAARPPSRPFPTWNFWYFDQETVGDLVGTWKILAFPSESNPLN